MRALTLSELILLNILRERERMAGEIRSRLDRWRHSKAKLIGEFDRLIEEAESVHGERGGLDLARAELRATKQELGEFQAEFVASTNAGPPGPLPDAGDASPEPSPQPAAEAPRSQKIWPID